MGKIYLIPSVLNCKIGCSTVIERIILNIAIWALTELKISLLYIIRKQYGYLSYWFLLNYLRINYLFSTLFKPKYWYLLKVLLAGAPLSMSLKTKQKIQSWRCFFFVRITLGFTKSLKKKFTISWIAKWNRWFSLITNTKILFKKYRIF